MAWVFTPISIFTFYPPLREVVWKLTTNNFTIWERDWYKKSMVGGYMCVIDQVLEFSNSYLEPVISFENFDQTSGVRVSGK